jgi:aryl-alcohol dehydrogenase-like predicted oxidoreductase
MDYTHLGRSGVSVSRLCLGTMNFGAFTDAADAHQIMDHAVEHGINFFDTANTYGRPGAEGVTEQIVGDWLTTETLAGMRPQIEAYEVLCAEIGEDPAVVGLAWLLDQPAVTAPIVGPSSLAQLEGALRALEIRLDEKSLGRLDEIFPGPGGAAPEAYAW